MSRGSGVGLFSGDGLGAFLHTHTTVCVGRALSGIMPQLVYLLCNST